MTKWKILLNNEMTSPLQDNNKNMCILKLLKMS